MTSQPDGRRGDIQHIQISVRMPVDLVRQLERRAADEDRTLSAELRRLARRSFGAEGQQAPQRPTREAA
jgi:hypothetical protein